MPFRLWIEYDPNQPPDWKRLIVLVLAVLAVLGAAGLIVWQGR